MGDLAEFWKDSRTEYKERCKKRGNKYVPQLLEIGAYMVQTGVYQKGDWFCYPTKGFAMQKKTNRKMNLDKFIKEYRNQAQM